MKYYSVIKKKTKIMSFEKIIIMSFATTWMDLEIFILSEKSQTDKDKYYMVSHICKNYFKNDTTKLIDKTEIDSQT